jgi:hypothetical protein
MTIFYIFPLHFTSRLLETLAVLIFDLKTILTIVPLRQHFPSMKGASFTSYPIGSSRLYEVYDHK